MEQGTRQRAAADGEVAGRVVADVQDPAVFVPPVMVKVPVPPWPTMVPPVTVMAPPFWVNPPTPPVRAARRFEQLIEPESRV